MKSKLVVTTVAALSVPSFAFASVQVTEIMYDLPGADAGREWVEIVNTGSLIDLKDYKFFNKEGGHLLKAYGSGDTQMPAGAVAVIADKPDMFLVDNPGYSGILIDSSFSLTSADTVGMKDPDGAIIDSVAYTSDMGAKGDGNTLQKSGSAFVAAATTPGTYAGASSTSSSSSSTQTTSSADTSNSSANSSTSSTTTSNTSSSISAAAVQKPDVPIKHITVDAGGDRVVTVGAEALYTAKVFGTAGEPIQNPRLIWNFGNGESREGRTVSFAYEYAGTYNLTVTGASGEYSSSDRVLVSVVSANIILLAETDGSLSLLNKERRDLDVSLWRMTRGGISFLIPANTILTGGQKVSFSMQTTSLPKDGAAQLLYPNGASVVASTALVASSTASSTPSSSSVSAKPEAVENVGKSKSTYIAAAVIGAVDEAGAPTDKSKTSETPWTALLAGALGLGVLGAASVVFMRRGVSGAGKETTEAKEPSLSKLADTYEIIE